jgi:hypothetical protein
MNISAVLTGLKLAKRLLWNKTVYGWMKRKVEEYEKADRERVAGAGDGVKPDGVPDGSGGVRVGVGDNRGANRGFSRDEPIGATCEPAHVKRGPAPRDNVATP